MRRKLCVSRSVPAVGCRPPPAVQPDQRLALARLHVPQVQVADSHAPFGVLHRGWGRHRWLELRRILGVKIQDVVHLVGIDTPIAADTGDAELGQELAREVATPAEVVDPVGVVHHAEKHSRVTDVEVAQRREERLDRAGAATGMCT